MLRTVVVCHDFDAGGATPVSLSQMVNDRIDAPARYRSTISRTILASSGRRVILSGSYPKGRAGPCGRPFSAFCNILRRIRADLRPDSLAANAAKIRAMNNPSSLPKSMSAVTVATSRTPTDSHSVTKSSNSTGRRCSRSRL
ncbi:Uncharacterised protein [Mycobacteroides abscessus]|nr:Uncharacterised protein [Mycobacteroides abscessus]